MEGKLLFVCLWLANIANLAKSVGEKAWIFRAAVQGSRLFAATATLPHRKMGFAALILVLDFLALNTLCAVTICVSAYFRTTFHAVVVSCAVWIGPVLFRIICRGGGYLFMAGTPLFLVMPGVVLDIYRVLFIPVSVAVGILGICMYLGLNRYSANAI